MKTPKHGGAREGSGRKPLDKAELHPRVSRALKAWLEYQAPRDWSQGKPISAAQLAARYVEEGAERNGFSAPHAKATP